MRPPKPHTAALNGVLGGEWIAGISYSHVGQLIIHAKEPFTAQHLALRGDAFGLGDLGDTLVARRRRDQAKIGKVSQNELNAALQKPQAYGYGQSRWKPGCSLNFEIRRDIIRTRLLAGFPELGNDFGNRQEPLEGDDERTTLAAFLSVEKERESSQNRTYQDAALYNVHLSQRERLLASEELVRCELYPVSLVSRQDLLRPQVGEALRPNLHLCRFFRVYDTEDVIVICNVPYVPNLPPLPISKRLRADGRFGYHEETWYPQMHHAGRWHMAFCPGLGTVHSDLRSDLAWYRVDLAAHFVVDRVGQYRASPELRAAIAKLCDSEKDTYDRLVTTQLGAPHQAIHIVTFSANYLCTHMMSESEVLEVFAQFQRGVLELRAWNVYEHALSRTRQLARRLARRERWDRAAPQNRINTEHRGVFVTDFTTANIYGHLEAPVWVLRGRSHELIDILKRQGLRELQPSHVHDLPKPVVTLMPVAPESRAATSAYGRSLYDDRCGYGGATNEYPNDVHESQVMDIDEQASGPSSPFADATAPLASPAPARATSQSKTECRKRRAQESVEGKQLKRPKPGMENKSDHWFEKQNPETQVTSNWFPVTTRWRDMRASVDGSTARMDRLYADKHAPVRFVKSKMLFRTPRPHLFNNKKDDQRIFSTWIIIRPFVLKMLVLLSMLAMPGLQREQWRSLVKLTLGDTVARSLYAILGLDGFFEPAVEMSMDQVEDHTVRGSDLIEQGRVDERAVSITPEPHVATEFMDVKSSQTQPAPSAIAPSLAQTSARRRREECMIRDAGGYPQFVRARRPASPTTPEEQEDEVESEVESGDARINPPTDEDVSGSNASDKDGPSVAYRMGEIVTVLAKQCVQGEAPSRGEAERHEAEPGDWHDPRTHLRYFYEAQSFLMQEFEKSHPNFEKITGALECWFDYDNRRMLYFANYPRVGKEEDIVPVGEQQVMRHKYTFKNLRGRELPDEFISRRIWPYRATPAAQLAVEPAPITDATPDDPLTASAASATLGLPWVDNNHGLEFTRLVVRMSASTKSFDEHPLKPWADPNWLTDDLRAYIVWELLEMDFRNGLYTLDFILRAAHPDLDLAKIAPAQRTAQLHACWGGGDMKPNEANPSPYSLPEDTPELLRALTAMFDFMVAWPRAEEHLRRRSTPWDLSQVDMLAKMVFDFYAQTYFDYIRCPAPLPILRPRLPW
ncbi:hypothetical protein AURDEDRAFT_177304 [Auricularia subglabra TFB-10046 SS5]|uniref:Uncharacterized protein n=1 Tax=Auricularia subglabra (strain TFB-10046 / SS5) TaxID=717982 RepID=J0WP26_AURST|nr:hypothetical protein AURDEDRAFT_177304 [Auricularia subglabra TFB-10046 SS5]